MAKPKVIMPARWLCRWGLHFHREVGVTALHTPGYSDWSKIFRCDHCREEILVSMGGRLRSIKPQPKLFTKSGRLYWVYSDHYSKNEDLISDQLHHHTQRMVWVGRKPLPTDSWGPGQMTARNHHTVFFNLGFICLGLLYARL